ncbi:MAG: UTP--glucose-1-phosphate uridylyltransferase [Gammaproteobacteria bacterium]|nr:UTP--glucose-1-phosphate uridylyltransferase [Gammaproteobacteria bacterium]
MILSIDIVVLPVAGLGSRFLPATKVIPKEMLPIVDIPLIQLAVNEAINAGVREIVLVTNPEKPAIEAYFRPQPVLEQVLIKKGNQAALKSIRDTLPEGVTMHITYQYESLGLGHAVLCAEKIVGDRPFAVMLPDDLIDGGGTGCLADMVQLYNYTSACSLAVEEVPREQTNKYGIVQLKGYNIIAMVEKPDPEEAPSTLAVVGRYVLPSAIFSALKKVQPGVGGEIQLTDGIAAILDHFEFRAHRFEGTRYDCGSKLGHLKANMVYAFKDPALAIPLRQWIVEYLLKT